MKSINITKEGILQYYGNRAGYIKNDTAFVDEMFKKADVEEFLTKENGFRVEWQKDIYDRLVKGDIDNKNQITLKKCRLYQLKPSSDIESRYIGYKELKDRGFKEPNMDDYKIVYDGNVATNNLEGIYAIFDASDKPEGFKETGIFISDVIELYDESSSEFYYVNPSGFEKLNHFTEPKMEAVRKFEKHEDNMKPKQEEKVFEPVLTTEIAIETLEENEPRPMQEPKNIEEPSVKEEAFQVETFKITM